MTMEAMLEHGNTYTLAGGRGGASRVIRKDVWEKVTDKELDYLEENALERILMQQGSVKTTQFVQKFKFRKANSNKDTGSDEGRKRTRKRTRLSNN